MLARLSLRRHGMVLLVATCSTWCSARWIAAASLAQESPVCTWTELAANVPRAQHVLVPLPAIENGVYAFGGWSGAPAGSAVMSDTYRLSLGAGTQGTWSPVPSSGQSPGPRGGHAAVLRQRSLGFEIVTYGGYDGVPGILLASSVSAASGGSRREAPGPEPLRLQGTRSDTHALGLQGQWREIRAEAAAPRVGHAVLYWPERDWLLSFGGIADRYPLSATLRLALGAEIHAWAPLETAGDGPPPLFGHTVVYDSHNEQALLYGGTYSGVTSLADLWTLSLGGDIPTWMPVEPVGQGPGGRFEHTAVFLPGPRLMAVFGGTRDGQEPLDDLHLLDVLSHPPRWIEVDPRPVRPPGRFGAAAAPVGEASMVLYGGQTATDALADTWLLRCSAPDGTATPSATATSTVEPSATPEPTSGTPPAELAMHGLVFDTAAGRDRPIWGATVRARPCRGAHQPFVGISGPDGSYRVLLPGMYYSFGCTVEVEVLAPGYETLQVELAYGDLVTEPERDFGLTPVGTATPTATVEPGNIELHGLVYDASVGPGRPIESALVRVPACHTPHQPFAGQTGTDGRYIVVLPVPYFLPGCLVHIEVSAPGFVATVLDVAYEDLAATPERDIGLWPEGRPTPVGPCLLPYLTRATG